MKPNSAALPRLVLAGMLGIVPLLGFTGCMEMITPQPFSAEQRVIGKSEQQLVACAGPPRTASSHDGVRILTYHRESGLLEGSSPGSKSSRPEGARHGCTAIVTLQNDRVTEVQYHMTPESTATHEHCEEIFQRCGP
ncbi:MAG TPA: hypothetical protein VNM72_04935 [Blastocatellia bacterium]|nr:hypothetical protein [Blastocatellia bacterium]